MNKWLKRVRQGRFVLGGLEGLVKRFVFLCVFYIFGPPGPPTPHKIRREGERDDHWYIYFNEIINM